MPMPPYRVNDAYALELARNVVAGFSFGAGLSMWRPQLSVVLDENGFVEFKAIIYVPHRDEPKKIIDVMSSFRLPLDHLDRLSMFGSLEAEIFGRVRALLFDLIHHERDESIRWRGKIFSDPHSPHRRYKLE